jgi:hypothetical protein
MGRQETRSKDPITLFYAFTLIIKVIHVICIMMEFRYRTTGASLLLTDLSFTGNPLLPCIFSTAHTALRWTAGHLDFSGLPVDFRIMFTKPRVSENELLFSKVRDCKKSPFGMGFVLEYEIHNFYYSSIFIRSTINIEDRDRFGEFKEMESGTFGIVSVNELASCTTVYQGINRLNFSSIHSFKFHSQLKRIGLSLHSCNDKLGWKSSLPFWAGFRMEWTSRSRR